MDDSIRDTGFKLPEDETVDGEEEAEPEPSVDFDEFEFFYDHEEHDDKSLFSHNKEKLDAIKQKKGRGLLIDINDYNEDKRAKSLV